MKWITRERVKVDRVACPWLIKKFVDKDAEFLFVPTDQVMEVAERERAIPYDVKNVELGHHGKECSFEAYIVEAVGRRLCCEQRDEKRKDEMLMRKQNRSIGQGKQLWRGMLWRVLLPGAVMVIVVLRLFGAPVCQVQRCAALSSRPAKQRAGGQRDGEGETR
jgi:hypothetical protein